MLCRITVGALVLTGPAVVALRGRWHLLRAHARLLVAYGLVAVAGCQLAYFNAVDRLPVAVALLIEYTAPVAVIAWLWVRHGQRPSGLTLVGAAVAGGGLMLVLDVINAGAVDGLGVVWGAARDGGLRVLLRRLGVGRRRPAADRAGGRGARRRSGRPGCWRPRSGW